MLIPLKNITIVLPFIKKKNRTFKYNNILIPEIFLINGENMLYILLEVFKAIPFDIKAKNIFKYISLFDFENIEENSEKKGI